MQNLFTNLHKNNMPLASRMRPQTLSEFLGQTHIVGKNTPLYRAIMANKLSSCIFYGPPGTGKTTLAGIIANTCGGYFESLNAVSSGVAEAKQIIDEAKKRFELYGKKTFLLLDEIHRWSKAQSDLLLPAIENGTITLIGSTTENPYISLTRAIISRCTVYEFLPLTSSDIEQAIKSALENKAQGLGNIEINITDDAIKQLVFLSGGDVRTALNALEIAALTCPKNKKGQVEITADAASECFNRPKMSLDESSYFDMLSAFCKSLRGSDENAALYWAFRMIAAGVDEKVIARRMIAHASEDIGMADSYAITMAINALTACEKIGPPECHLALAHAIVYIAYAPKSNAVYLAKAAAMKAVETSKDDTVPFYLKNHPSNEFVLNAEQNKRKQSPCGFSTYVTYKYPHDFGGWCDQQYLPDSLKDAIFYKPTINGAEKILKKGK